MEREQLFPNIYMIQTSTFIGILISFFITTIVTEKYYINHGLNIRLRKMIGYIAIYMFVLLTIVVLIPQTFIILVYGSVVMSSFFTVYNRHRKLPGEIDI